VLKLNRALIKLTLIVAVLPMSLWKYWKQPTKLSKGLLGGKDKDPAQMAENYMKTRDKLFSLLMSFLALEFFMILVSVFIFISMQMMFQGQYLSFGSKTTDWIVSGMKSTYPGCEIFPTGHSS